MRRTIDDIDAEERQLTDRMLEINVELKDIKYPDRAYESVRLNNQLPPGFKTPQMLRNELEVIKQKIASLEAEKANLVGQVAQSAPAMRRPNYGELDQIVELLVKRDKVPLYETVPSKKIAAWVREYEKMGIELDQASLRKKLSDKGYSKEKRAED